MQSSEFLVIDTETNKLPDYKLPADSPDQPRIAAVAMLICDKEFNILATYSSVIKPDVWVFDDNSEAAKVNGLTHAKLMADGEPIINALAIYTDMIKSGAFVVAHNAQHDCKMMRGELRRANMDDLFMITKNVCTMRGSAPICDLKNKNGKGQKWPKLSEACTHFKIPHLLQHTPIGDATAALAIYRKLVEMNAAPEPAVHLAKNPPKGTADANANQD